LTENTSLQNLYFTVLAVFHFAVAFSWCLDGSVPQQHYSKRIRHHKLLFY